MLRTLRCPYPRCAGKQNFRQTVALATWNHCAFSMMDARVHVPVPGASDTLNIRSTSGQNPTLTTLATYKNQDDRFLPTVHISPSRDSFPFSSASTRLPRNGLQHNIPYTQSLNNDMTRVVRKVKTPIETRFKTSISPRSCSCHP